MLAVLYPIIFFIVLTALVLWIYFQDSTKLANFFRRVLLFGTGVYLSSIFLIETTMSERLFAVFRDALVIGGAAMIFSLLRKYQTLFVIGLGISLGLAGLYFPILKNTAIGNKQDTVSELALMDLDKMALDKTGELLLELKAGEQPAVLKEIFEKYGLVSKVGFNPERFEETDLDDYLVLDVPQERRNDLHNIIAELEDHPAVDWVESNEIIMISPLKAKTAPARKKKKFQVNDPEVSRQWSFDVMEVDKVYNLMEKKLVKPQRKARIAILDTGVDAEHEDLKGNYHSTQEKYDNDPVGHGSHCAGIAGAVSNNGIGIASMALNQDFVEITSVKVLNAAGSGTQQGIIAGIIEAADKGADVISMSLGGRASRLKQKAYEDAVAYANKAGAIVVVAAGNSNSNAKSFAPANVNGVITVSAIDTLLKRAHFSNTIQDLKRGLAAPGVQIYSTIPNNNYAYFNGTSMATPYVAGIVGIMKSIRPNLTTDEVFAILNSTGVVTKNNHKTGRLINPSAALEELLK